MERYQRRISGPLLDRVDMHVRLEPLDPRLLVGEERMESSGTVGDRVQAARERQVARNLRGDVGVTNAELRPADLERYARLGEDEIRHLLAAASALGLTARSWHRVIRVARTIADLAEEETIGSAAISEALTYRLLDREEASRGIAVVPRRGGEGRSPGPRSERTRAEVQGGA